MCEIKALYWCMIRPVWFILTEKMNKFQRVIIFVEMIIISFEKYDVWKVEDLSLSKSWLVIFGVINQKVVSLFPWERKARKKEPKSKWWIKFLSGLKITIMIVGTRLFFLFLKKLTTTINQIRTSILASSGK